MRDPKDIARPIVDRESGKLQGFRLSQEGVRKNAINRRAFLRGAGTVAIGLPFLEGLPERSAWAATSPPVFTMFIVGSCGVVGESFLPDATGALTTSGLAGMTTKAVSALSAHAPNLTMLKQINWPQNVKSCGHAEGLCQAITAIVPGATGHGAYAGGLSADVAIGKAVNPTGVDPIILYSAAKGAYIADRISWRGAGADQLRSGDQNPYTLYQKLVGLTNTTSTGTGGTGGTTTDPVAMELAATQKSVNDLVKPELTSLMNNPALSSDDKQRLQLHFDSIRDLEIGMGNAGMMCTQTGLDTTTLNAYKNFSFKTDGMIETVTLMHMQLVALAFACNYNRVAALQWGDGTDGTHYSTPAATQLGTWTFHQLSHRIMNDGATGNDPTAKQAHAEIDVVRMKTFAKGLDAFNARGLASNSMVMLNFHISDGPSHSGNNVPHIIWGNGGGFLKTGQFLDAGKVTNNKLLNTIITAAVRDKSTTAVDFGKGTGNGMITAMLA
jgi:Protein of unknown function (DUF1552)